jgi:hypothetical protein
VKLDLASAPALEICCITEVESAMAAKTGERLAEKQHFSPFRGIRDCLIVAFIFIVIPTHLKQQPASGSSLVPRGNL